MKKKKGYTVVSEVVSVGNKTENRKGGLLHH